MPTALRDRTARVRTLACAALVAALLAGCVQEVPITGRKQLALVSAGQLQALSDRQYREILQQETLSTDARQTALLQRVGGRVSSAVDRYFAERGLADRLSGYAWEFRLIESEEQNAFCMPGGKVAVYTGLLPITKDENGLAVVVSHEIAHAVAQHARERMSQALVLSGLGLALDRALADQGDKTRNIFRALYGAGAGLGVMLPHSRRQEAEADRLGLVFMAMAGYDPRGAVDLWQRMAAADQGPNVPVFLRTHPTDQARIAAIREDLPEALSYYRDAR